MIINIKVHKYEQKNKLKIMKKIKLVSLAIITLFLIANISSCTGDDGIDGLQGPVGITGADGADGADGIDGQDGTDGVDGVDGIDGQDGADGADGNANVSTYVFNNPTWTELDTPYMKLSLRSFLTEHNIKEDVILGYAKNKNRTTVYSIPGLYHGPNTWKNYSMEISTVLNIFIHSFELDGSLTPYADLLPMEWFKCIIIPSSTITSTTGNGFAAKGLSKQQKVINKLEAAGVNVKDYNAVCDYYGIAKK